MKPKESKNSSDDEQAPVAKRGRGRPKGSKKKAAAPKAKVRLLSYDVYNIECHIFYIN